jgi:amino-acid N-acetyltransferase
MAEALSEARLPTDDISEYGRTFFRFDDDGTVGFGGLELGGPDRLLRSLIILPQRRGTGLGSVFLSLIESTAIETGARRLHLITETAAPFFRAHGYADAARGDAPAPVAATREFTTLCPASASYLVKSLGNP